ncbi:DNA-binding protein P3A2 [Strongylocentrotus purpuratus]|uniref:DNA-binding protein P3A2 n=1 Tax=Strongylocentrotus purpuratus TaxID=7668 RepID=P3A2_STRPU|nr:DNA-binding protein P3A2 [Strongylocentrotus purpuratus]Q04073.1 RecName: Full=DNA-binding protein P3A2 [Strongylocentrotus purpuratus]CAA40333.1 P3A2 protein [Strongylocentrotus purpuratus]|eukprot:NP_999758.1 DNA-binding protein P3A2 [Strongylocentrotus purpuratus]
MMISEDISEPSSPDTPFDDSDLLNSSMTDDVSAQLAASGPIGVRAAAAIATGKKRKRPHSFETNPSIRRRQQTRLIRKLKATIDEYATRVGQQAVVLTCTPGKHDGNFKVFGAAPLENIMRNLKGIVLQDLDNALAQRAPQPSNENSDLYELPPLVIDGIPTSVNKMTQAQLRAFIPLMLKYSTGRGKPGWGKESCRPVWWPSDLPWANVRSDVRSEDEKRKVSWTHALVTIVINCYKHHGRDDLLPEFIEDKCKEIEASQNQVASLPTATLLPSHAVVHTINNPDGTVSLIQVDTGATVATLADVTQVQQLTNLQTLQQVRLQPLQIQHALGNQQAEATQAVQTLAEVAAAQGGDGELTEGQTVTTLPEGTQLVLASDGSLQAINDGTAQGIVIPASVYQTVVAGDGQPIQIANVNIAQQSGGGTTMAAIKNAVMQSQPIPSQVATLVVNAASHDQHT